MALLKVAKVVSTLPGVLEPDSIYLVRTGDGFDLFVVDSTGSVAYQPNRRAETWDGHKWSFSDFYNSGASNNPPFTLTAISTGTFTTLPATALTSNQGVVLLRASNTNNSGVRVQTTQPIISAAGLVFRAVLSIPNLSTRTVRLGFLDTTTNADAVDGMYFEIVNLTVSAKTANNSTRTTNPTTADLTANTFYVFDIEQTTSGNVRFVITDYATKTVLLDVNITTNIPTSAIARAFFCGLVVTNAATTATDLVLLDYMGFGPAKPTFVTIPFT